MLKAECALLGKHRQGDLCALKGILVYMISSRSPRAAQTVLNKKEGGRESERARERRKIFCLFIFGCTCIYMYMEHVRLNNVHSSVAYTLILIFHCTKKQ